MTAPEFILWHPTLDRQFVTFVDLKGLVCMHGPTIRKFDPEDQSYVRMLVPEAERDLVEILAGLRRGDALALGEGVPLPTRFRLHQPKPTPNSDDVDFCLQWKDGPQDINVDEIVDRWRRQER